MSNREDSEITISLWSPEWLDGSGVARLAEWYTAAPRAWEPAEVMDVNNDVLGENVGSVRNGGHAMRRLDASSPPEDTTPIVYEIHKLRDGRSGPLERRIVEYAPSTIGCPIGLHSVDVRRPLPVDAFSPRKSRFLKAQIEDVITELRALREALPLTWAVCSTLGRGPSIAELFNRRGSSAQLGYFYVSKAASKSDISEANCAFVDVGAGYEVALTTRFGGSFDAPPSAVYGWLWKVMRKASLSGLPWETMKILTDLGS